MRRDGETVIFDQFVRHSTRSGIVARAPQVIRMSNFVHLITCHDDTPALVMPGREPISYRSLRQRTDRLAGWLSQKNVATGTRVFIAVSPGPDFYPMMLAIFKLGAIAVLVEKGFSTAQIRSCLRKSKPDVILGSALNLIKISFLSEAWQSRRIRWSPSQSFAAPPTADVSDDHTALITFTSGSTGMPRGINRTHAILIHQHLALKSAFPDPPPQVHLTAFPVVTLHNLCCGYTTVLADVDRENLGRTSPAILENQFRRHRVTSVSAPPSMYRLLKTQQPGVGTVIVGGAPVDFHLVQKMLHTFPNAAGYILYGSSEAEPITSISLGDYVRIDLNKGGFCVGRPVRGADLAVIRGVKDGEDVRSAQRPPFEIGEIVVTGRHVTANYFEDPDSDRRHKIRDSAGKIWHRTGDLGYLDDVGRLWLVGRKGHEIHYAGRTYHSLVIESFVNRIDGVLRSALSVNAEGIPVLWIVPEGTAIPDAVRTFAAEHAIPVVLQTASFPLDARHHSKIDYPALRARTAGVASHA